ncbi:MAG TPA: amino acid permease [Sedimenticola sp.]|nr:amino acid permease [Sedimenticola sp.]
MDKKIGLWQAVSIAVGTMIGASIFSVFGLGARIAGHNLPLVFVISGALALLVAYSYATLGAKIVSNAGPMEFILRGLGDGVLTGALSILSWLTYVISIALFAKGFAGYLLPLLHLPATGLAVGVTEAGIIGLFLAVNFLGPAAVGKAEFFIVLIKVGVLGVFVVLGLWTIRPGWLSPGFDPAQVKGTLYAVAVFFLSYMGFGLVTNASENMVNPRRNVPRAIYLSILIVTLIYVAVATVAVGNLPLNALVRAQDFALAEAAKPFLGSAGYLLVSLGALFSIASALNATLYGGANIAYALARDGELPEFFERKGWFQASEGLYITAGLSLLFALAFDLNGIAAITSAVFMVIYLFVLVAHYRLAPRFGGNRPFIVFALAAVLAVFVLLMLYQWRTDQSAFYTTLAAFAASLGLEAIYRGISRRALQERE